LTSVLMAQYHPDWINADNGLPNGSAPTVFDLGQNDKLTALIEQNHLGQWSAEVIHYFLDWQTSDHSAADVFNQISGMLAVGDHPIISLQSGANHSVVAYALEPGPKGTGDYFIDVYDPNRPYNGEFDLNEYIDVANHRTIEQASRIYVDPASGWSFQMA